MFSVCLVFLPNFNFQWKIYILKVKINDLLNHSGAILNFIQNAYELRSTFIVFLTDKIISNYFFFWLAHINSSLIFM